MMCAHDSYSALLFWVHALVFHFFLNVFCECKVMYMSGYSITWPSKAVKIFKDFLYAGF
jgi:hypothetical protein